MQQRNPRRTNRSRTTTSRSDCRTVWRTRSRISRNPSADAAARPRSARLIARSSSSRVLGSRVAERFMATMTCWHTLWFESGVSFPVLCLGALLEPVDVNPVARVVGGRLSSAVRGAACPGLLRRWRCSQGVAVRRLDPRVLRQALGVFCHRGSRWRPRVCPRFYSLAPRWRVFVRLELSRLVVLSESGDGSVPDRLGSPVQRQLLWPLALPHLRMLPACLKLS